MKIALVAQEYFPEGARGGIGTQTYVKAKGLSALGHEVFIICRSSDGQRHEIPDNNIWEIRIPGMEEVFPEMTTIVQWLTHSNSVAAELEALHCKVGLDIIDFPEWAAEGYTYLLNRTAWKTVPTVVQLHGPLVMFAHVMGWPETNSPFYRTGVHMEASCVQLADAVYSSSNCSSNWVRKYYNPKEDFIPTIHLGVDTKNFSNQNVEKYKRPTIVFVGKIVPNKGVEELVEAACRLLKIVPDLRLKLFGRANEAFKSKLLERAQKAGSVQLLEFPGFISKNELPLELSRANVFAAPSWYEGGPGFVYLEAMACELPVIGCSGSGVEEIIDSGKNGLLIPPKDAKALEEALLRVLIDKKFSSALGKKARQYVVEEAESELCIKKVEALYKSVIEKNKMKEHILINEN